MSIRKITVIARQLINKVNLLENLLHSVNLCFTFSQVSVFLNWTTGCFSI